MRQCKLPGTFRPVNDRLLEDTRPSQMSVGVFQPAAQSLNLSERHNSVRGPAQTSCTRVAEATLCIKRPSSYGSRTVRRIHGIGGEILGGRGGADGSCCWRQVDEGKEGGGRGRRGFYSVSREREGLRLADPSGAELEP